MAEIDNFAPDVDIEAELAAEPVEVAEPAPAPEPEPTPEPVAETHETSETPVKVPPGYVEKEALSEARAIARLAKEQKEALEREFAEYRQKLEKRVELLANPPAPVPKFEDDPAAHLKHQTEAIRQEIEPVKQALEQTRQQQEQAAAEARLTQAVSAAEAEFAAKTPDYLDAIAHMQKVADTRLKVMGVDNADHRAQLIRRDAMALAVRALQAGKSPAELAYELAKVEGYNPAPATNKVVENIQKGQKATPSMPSGGASVARSVLQNLEAMDDDAIAELVDDPDKWRKLMRGA